MGIAGPRLVGENGADGGRTAASAEAFFLPPNFVTEPFVDRFFVFGDGAAEAVSFEGLSGLREAVCIVPMSLMPAIPRLSQRSKSC